MGWVKVSTFCMLLDGSDITYVLEVRHAMKLIFLKVLKNYVDFGFHMEARTPGRKSCHTTATRGRHLTIKTNMGCNW